VADEQTIHVRALALELGVSEMTVRRDIRRLERDGFLRQTYGGATAHLTRSLDVAFNARALRHAREKRLIAMRAAGLVDDARVIFLGIGTTSEHFARYLPARPGLTVVTASLPIASLLGTRAIRVIGTGGEVLQHELTFGGPIAIAALARYRFDVAVVGAAGVSARWGITELTDAEADVQRAALARAGRVVVIADGSKVGTATSAVVGQAASITTLVTDRTAAPSEVADLRDLGVEVVQIDFTPEPSAGPATPRDRRSHTHRSTGS
jgi:DeoR/GlpR family transcriptional regulator of sugar metabolism